MCGPLGRIFASVRLNTYRCFFAELLTGKPLLPGKNEHQELLLIYDKCGSPNEKSWPGVSALRFWSELGPKTQNSSKLRNYFKDNPLYFGFSF